MKTKLGAELVFGPKVAVTDRAAVDAIGDPLLVAIGPVKPGGPCDVALGPLGMALATAAVDTRETLPAAATIDPGGTLSATAACDPGGPLPATAAMLNIRGVAAIAAPMATATAGLGAGRSGDRQRGNAGG